MLLEVLEGFFVSFCFLIYSGWSGARGGVGQVSQIWISLFLSLRFIASYLAFLGGFIS